MSVMLNCTVEYTGELGPFFLKKLVSLPHRSIFTLGIYNDQFKIWGTEFSYHQLAYPMHQKSESCTSLLYE